MTKLRELLMTLEGRRVEGEQCYCCGSQEFVLRQRWCKDELEMFCDRCECWTGLRITTADVETWLRRCRYRFPLYSFNEVADGVMERCLVVEAAVRG
jgi:hypothetical protein